MAGFKDIGLGSQFDIAPDELKDALEILDSMMAEWNVQGIRVGYPIGTIDTSSLDTKVGVPDSAIGAIRTNLAILLAPSYGKIPAREIKVAAKKGYGTLQMRALSQNMPNKQYPSTLPIGSGNRRYNNRNQNFFPTPTDDVDVGPDSILELN